ncbi:hypothetical protein GGS26DRAFT_551947 [Hypomontagnella submonticulosa]|nr:hypothetical protein GGS26DRAFT_551947 [Hypomontagnella submonticulosa]
MFDPIDLALFIFLVTIFLSSRFASIVSPHPRTPSTPIMINRRGGARIPQRRIPLIPPPSREQEPPSLTNTYEARPEDIVEVKSILSKARNLPPELVDMILDRAEYWACSAAIIDYSNHPSKHISIHGGSPGEDQFLLRTEPLGLTKWSPSSQDLWRVESAPKQLKREYPESKLQDLVEGPISTLEHPFRKVVFDITSRDQGWSSHHNDHGTYRSSFTWFDAGLERFDMDNECPSDCPDRRNQEDSRDTTGIPTCAIRPIWPPVVANEGSNRNLRYNHELNPVDDHLIQRNKHAEKGMQHHHVEWSWDDDIDPESLEADTLVEAGRGAGTGNGEFVRNLKLGDMITVWGRARFPAWTNNIQRVEVKVYWAF